MAQIPSNPRHSECRHCRPRVHLSSCRSRGESERQLAVFGIMVYQSWRLSDQAQGTDSPFPVGCQDLPDQVSRKLDGLREFGYAPAAVSTITAPGRTGRRRLGLDTRRSGEPCAAPDWLYSQSGPGTAPSVSGALNGVVRTHLGGGSGQSFFLPAEAMLVLGAEYPELSRSLRRRLIAGRIIRSAGGWL